MQAIISLNGMYEAARRQGNPQLNEGEFRAYHLLTLIGTHGRYRYNAGEYQIALQVTRKRPLQHYFHQFAAGMILVVWKH